MSKKDKIESIISNVKQNVENRIVQKKKKSAGKSKGDVAQSVLKKAINAYKDAYVRYHLRCRGVQQVLGQGLSGKLSASELKKYRIKPVVLTNKDLGILKNVLSRYSYDVFERALLTIANTLAPNNVFSVSLVASEVARQGYYHQNVEYLLQYSDENGFLYKVPVAVIEGPAVERKGQYKFATDGLIEVDMNLQLICPQGISVDKTYENNIQALKVVLEKGDFIRVLYSPSKFSASLFGVEGNLISYKKGKAKVELYVKVIDLNEQSIPQINLVLPEDNRLSLDFRLITPIESNEEVDEEYQDVFTEVRKSLMRGKMIVMNDSGFPVQLFIYYLKRRTDYRVVGVNVFNSSIEYFDSIVVVDLRGQGLEQAAAQIVDFYYSEAISCLFLVDYPQPDFIGFYRSLLRDLKLSSSKLLIAI